MNLACLTHAYPRWEGDVAGAFIERLVLALTARGHGVHVVAPADAGKGGKELRHQVPVTRVRYAPARRETLAYRGTMVAAVRSPAGLLFAASLIQRQARVVARLCREVWRLHLCRRSSSGRCCTSWRTCGAVICL